MPCTLEHLTAPEIFLLRQGPQHHRYGDPYDLAGVVEVFGTHAVFKGVNGLLRDIPSLRAELRKIGVKTVRWERIKAGETIQHSLEVG